MLGKRVLVSLLLIISMISTGFGTVEIGDTGTNATNSAIIKVVNSLGESVEGASVKYMTSSWYGPFETDSNGEVKIDVPSKFSQITARVEYEGGKQDIKQNIVESPTIEFKTVRVNTRLIDSNGAGLEGGAIIYSMWTWKDYGFTDSDGNSYKELLPGTYNFRMKYQNGQIDIKQDVGSESEVVFQTKKVNVRLIDSNNNGLEEASIIYSRSSWGEYGITDIEGNSYREMLPGTYSFRMEYAKGRQDIKQDISVDDLVIFRTYPLSVSCKSSAGDPLEGIKIRYSRASWDDFGYTAEDGNVVKELLPSLYTVRAYLPEGYTDQKVELIGEALVAFQGEKPIEYYKLNASASPTEGGTIDATPKKDNYIYGEKVTLTAHSNEGYEFKGFTGYGTDESIVVTMNKDITITGVFEKIEDPSNPDDPGNGEDSTIIVHNISELNQAEIKAREGNITILVDDGVYELSDQFMVRGNNVTVKSLNGNPDAVIIKGKGVDGSVPHVFSVYADNFTLEDVTIGWVHNHGIQIHAELDADYPVIRNVHIRDTREQMIKVSGSNTVDSFSDGGIVENCTFSYTEGIAPQWYVGGVDAHKAKNWTIRNNRFEDIKSPEDRLTEGAIHFWSDSLGTLIEKNVIIDCDRGILLGLDSSHHYDGIIRNNFIHSTRDTGIYLANSHNTKVYNNTIFIDSDYPNAIEYRFEPTDAYILNNLSNRSITSRNGGTATVTTNITDAVNTWFVDLSSGDLHLKEAISSVIDKGTNIPELTEDIDGDIRESGAIDIGADEASGLVVVKITSVSVSADKYEIRGDGKDTSNLFVTVVFEDGSTSNITADSISVKDPDGNTRTLGDARFRSFITGDYTITAMAQDVVSEPIIIKVVEEDLYSLQASDIKLYHNKGQTFVTFEEIIDLIDNEDILYSDMFSLISSYTRDIKYNIYYSTDPITSVEGLAPIAVVDSLSGWNKEYYGKGNVNTKKPAMRYVIKEGEAPLGLSTGLYVNSSDADGTGYYAVTAVVDGKENKIVSTEVNSASIAETIGQGEPVLQRIESSDNFQWIKDVKLHYYTRWEAPPNASIEGKPFDYVIGVPNNLADPAPVGIHMHCWGGSLNSGYGWWNDADDGALLLATNQYPYDWWTGYHENYYDSNSWTRFDSGVVHPYTTTRIISFMNWMKDSGRWNVDMTRSFTAGSSMGGSGSIMMAIRYPELISWNRSWVGVHDPNNTPTFRSSYEAVYGKRSQNVLFENGTPVWDYYNDIWYLNNHVSDSIGFISFANGKNDSAIGWQQAVDFINALQETRQPHLFIWGQSGHSQRTVLPGNGSEQHMMIDVRVDQSLPAFTRCSLDNDYGSGDPINGDPTGQVNRYLYWETSDIVDTSTTWELTAKLMNTAPEEQCLVDVTPRRLQNLKLNMGEKLDFEVVDMTTGQVINQGEIIVDQFGLVTLKQVTVLKSGVRIKITK